MPLPALRSVIPLLSFVVIATASQMASAGSSEAAAGSVGAAGNRCSGVLTVADGATGDVLGGLVIDGGRTTDAAGYSSDPTDWTHFAATDDDADGHYLLTDGAHDLGAIYRTVGDFSAGEPDYVTLGRDRPARNNDMWTFDEGVAAPTWRNRSGDRVALTPYGLAFADSPDDPIVSIGLATDLPAMEAHFTANDFRPFDLSLTPDGGATCPSSPCDRSQNSLATVREWMQEAKARVQRARATGDPFRIARAKAHKKDVRNRLASTKAEVAAACTDARRVGARPPR